MLERALRNEIEICGYNNALKRAVSDYLLPGSGVVWVRYEPQIAEGVLLPVESQTDMRDSQGNIPSRSDRDYDGGSDSDDEESITPKGRVRPKFNDQGEGEPQDQGEDQEPDQSEETTKLEETDDRVVREFDSGGRHSLE